MASIDISAPIKARVADLLSNMDLLDKKLDMAQRELEIMKRQREFEDKRATALERNMDRIIEAINKLCTLSVSAIEGGTKRRKVAPLVPVRG